MAWFKIDDQFWSHPKVNDLSAAAGWLWVRAGSWSANHLTDGYVSYGTVRMLGTVKLANELVKCGLWVKAEGGYKFHDWDVYQPSGEAVEKLREKRAEAGRLGAARRWRKLADDAAPDGNTDGEPVANAMASAMANAWQNDAPSPSPSPDPTDSNSGSQSGLSPVTRERDGDMTDYYESVRQVLMHDVGIPEPSTDEIHAWVTYVASKARTVVKDERAYALGAADRSPDEVDKWFVKHRRNQMKAVGE